MSVSFGCLWTFCLIFLLFTFLLCFVTFLILRVWSVVIFLIVTSGSSKMWKKLHLQRRIDLRLERRGEFPYSFYSCVLGRFFAAITVKVKEERLFSVYHHCCSYCNSLRMNPRPEMLRHLRSAGLFNVLEISNEFLALWVKQIPYKLQCGIL